ncbi:MAG: D-alanyl-D-alanine carboxypeptidase [Ruminococcaceae bacterium]|nr:D-alanyl-D-alanine carboxypeptidase [Oscillospiraceae bacterium]
MKRLGIFLALCLVLCCLPRTARGANLDVKGNSALLMDMATGTVLYEQNAHEKLAPASVTKVMTMLLVMEAIDSGKISWEDTVTVSEAAASKGGSQIYLKVGEQMSVTDMLKSVAVSSANDCACALAEHLAGSEAAFVEKMNQRARELGMKDTNFVNCTGLDDGENAKEHLTSAYDIALMSRELMRNHPDIQKFTTIWMDTVRNGAFGLANTNKLVRFYPGATGLKTGFTSAAGYCLSATAEREGLGLIAVVMGAKTSQERFSGCKAMLDYGFANYTLIAPETPQQNDIPVKLGTEKSVAAIPAEKVQLLLDKGQKDQVTTQVELEESLTAPVSKGQKIGTMTVKAGEQVLAQVPMVAQQAVPRLSWWELFVQVLQRLAMAKN